MIRPIQESSKRQLAAAQVIYDLAAAVKELIENSLDANASQITVTFFDSGLEAFEVLDDGDGISEDDMHLIGQRHHTSKITSDEEVLEVRTFGFRGEALHSLAALSARLEMISKPRSSDAQCMGMKLIIEGDNENLQRVATPSGTLVRIIGLLSSLPVRQAEWKRQSKRYFARALLTLQSYVLAAPDIRFRFVSSKGRSGQALFASSGGGDVSKAFVEAFPGELSKPLRSLEFSDVTFRGQLYYTLAGRKSADRQFCFVNNRPCDLPRVLRKLNELIKTYALPGFPIFLLYVETKAAIDINLTPDKRQVILTFEDRLVEKLVEVLSTALTSEDHRHGTLQPTPSNIPSMTPSMIPSMTPSMIPSTILSSSQIEPIPQVTATVSINHASKLGGSLTDIIPKTAVLDPSSVRDTAFQLERSCCLLDAPIDQDEAVENGSGIIERSDFLKMNVIGQFNCGFILTQLQRDNRDQFVYIIDQHASDERFRLERLQSELKFTIQSMLKPINLPLGLDAYLYLCEHQKNCAKYGFFIQMRESFDYCTDTLSRSVRLVRSPHVAGIQLGAEEMLTLMRLERFTGLYCLDRVAEALAYKACRSAIMIGDPLSYQQMTQVVRNLSSLSKPWICAHGRPTVRLLYKTKIPVAGPVTQ